MGFFFSSICFQEIRDVIKNRTKTDTGEQVE